MFWLVADVLRGGRGLSVLKQEIEWWPARNRQSQLNSILKYVFENIFENLEIGNEQFDLCFHNIGNNVAGEASCSTFSIKAKQ